MILKSLMYQDAKHMLKNFQIKNLKDMQNFKKKLFFLDKNLFFLLPSVKNMLMKTNFPWTFDVIWK